MSFYLIFLLYFFPFSFLLPPRLLLCARSATILCFEHIPSIIGTRLVLLSAARGLYARELQCKPRANDLTNFVLETLSYASKVCL